MLRIVDPTAGNRQLSASVAFGSVFSAVAGFAIDRISRDAAVWSTDAHARHETPNYTLTRTALPTDNGEDLVVSIGIPQDISAEVELALPAFMLATAPARKCTDCLSRPSESRRREGTLFTFSCPISCAVVANLVFRLSA